MSIKTYGWLGPERLKFINDNPKIVSLLYDLGLLPEEISARVRGYVEEAVKEERERCAQVAEGYKGMDARDRTVARLVAKEIRGT